MQDSEFIRQDLAKATFKRFRRQTCYKQIGNELILCVSRRGRDWAPNSEKKIDNCTLLLVRTLTVSEN